MIGASRPLSFCHISVPFLGLIFHRRRDPFRCNLLILTLRVDESEFLCEKATRLMLAWVYAPPCVCVCVCAKEATLSWPFQISLPHSSTERGSQEGKRVRLRDNGNGG